MCCSSARFLRSPTQHERPWLTVQVTFCNVNSGILLFAVLFIKFVVAKRYQISKMKTEYNWVITWKHRQSKQLNIDLFDNIEISQSKHHLVQNRLSFHCSSKMNKPDIDTYNTTLSIQQWDELGTDCGNVKFTNVNCGNVKFTNVNTKLVNTVIRIKRCDFAKSNIALFLRYFLLVQCRAYHTIDCNSLHEDVATFTTLASFKPVLKSLYWNLKYIFLLFFVIAYWSVHRDPTVYFMINIQRHRVSYL